MCASFKRLHGASSVCKLSHLHHHHQQHQTHEDDKDDGFIQLPVVPHCAIIIIIIIFINRNNIKGMMMNRMMISYICPKLQTAPKMRKGFNL